MCNVMCYCIFYSYFLTVMYLEGSIIICIFLQHMDLVSEINVYIYIYIYI